MIVTKLQATFRGQWLPLSLVLGLVLSSFLQAEPVDSVDVKDQAAPTVPVTSVTQQQTTTTTTTSTTAPVDSEVTTQTGVTTARAKTVWTADELRDLEDRTYGLVNQYRFDQGLPPLARSEDLDNIAREHSRNMATGKVAFGHDGFQDRVDKIKKDLPKIRSAGENVLMTDFPDDVAKRALESWLGSPHHLKNIRGDFNSAGLGVWVRKDGTVYFTQVFVKA